MCVFSHQPGWLIQFSHVCAGVLLGGLLACAVATAQPNYQPQYQFDHWTTDDGLPQNAVNAILQTRDGYLWLATYDGLVRFDSQQFTVYNKGNTKGIGSNRFDRLFEDHHGTLWALTENSWLVKYQAGVFTTYTPKEGLPPGGIQQLEEDEAGNFQVVSRERIAKWKDGRFITYPLKDVLPVSADVTWILGNKLTWLAGDKLYMYAHGQLSTYSIQSGLPSLNIRTVNTDQHGTVWISTWDAGLVRVEDGYFTSYPVKYLSGSFAVSAQEDQKGNIWLAWGDKGLGRLKDGRLTRYVPSQDFLVSENTSFYGDREGNLWIGSSDGLYRAREAVITVYTRQDGLSSDNVYSIYEDHSGQLWLGTWGGGVTKYEGGHFFHYRIKDGQSLGFITTLYEDRDSYLWIGTTYGLHLFKDGRLSAYPDPNGFFGDGAWAIHQDMAGHFWFGTSKGLIKLDGVRYTRYTTADGLAGDDVKAILEDRAGRLWFGTWSGLTRYDDGRFESYTEQDGLASDHIRTLYEDAEGILWIGTYDGGLCRFKDGRFTHYTTKDGLFNNGVFQILEDEQGYFWMSCNRGIYRVRRQELNDFADGKVRSITSIAYGKNDGLLTLECNGGRQPAGWKTRDGRLWFPTAQGAAVIDPSLVEINQHPPPVVIEELRLNKEAVPLSEVIEIQPDKNNNFEIRYQGLSFIKPEQIRFKYRLEGLDSDWIDAGNRRTAYYSHLPPGEYTFTVLAANSDGVWNEEGKSIRVIVKPPFWRTLWFISLTIVSVIGLASFAYKRRVSQLKREKAMEEALTKQLKKEKTMQEDFSKQLIDSQESERKRVAAELHDGLSQTLAIIKTRAQIALNERDNPSGLDEQLNDIASTATQVIDEMKEIAYNLRPYQLDRLGLTKTIKAMVNKVSDSHEIKFQTHIDNIDGVFTKDSELHILRIIQESISNIVNHSEATEAVVIIRKDLSGVEVAVKDNGKGLITESGGSNEPVRRGFGLIGIAERTRILGGKYTIQSIKGEGTTITVKLELEDGRDEK